MVKLCCSDERDDRVSKDPGVAEEGSVRLPEQQFSQLVARGFASVIAEATSE